MIIGIPRESLPGENRVAATPTTVPALLKLGYEVVVESGAGEQQEPPTLRDPDGSRPGVCRCQHLGERFGLRLRCWGFVARIG